MSFSSINVATLVSVAAVAGFTAYTAVMVAADCFKRAIATRALYTQGLHYPKSTLPLLGNTLDIMLFHKHRLHDWMAEQSKVSNGRPWILSLLGKPPALVVTSPEVCEDIFKTQFELFGLGEDFIELSHDFFGGGILNADGDDWQRQRRAASRLFSTKRLRGGIDEVVVEKTARLCETLAACAAHDQPLSMNELFAKFTSDAFAKIAFSAELGCLDTVDCGNGHPRPPQHPFIAAMAGSGKVYQARVISPEWMWKLQRWINVGGERELKENRAVVHQFLHEAMLKSMAKSKSETNPDLLAMLVDSKQLPDAESIRDAIMNFFAAAADTTAFSLSWFLVNMNRYPRILKKIREELSVNFPYIQTRIPVMDELQKLPYLEAAIRESLRLYMIMVCRTPTQSTTLSDGTFVPLGSEVIVSTYAAARMESVWGPDADEFRPERFIDEATGQLVIMSPFKFLSFIGGPRQCLGMRFAMLEMKTAVAAMLGRFDVETLENPHELTYAFSLLLPVKGKLMARVRPVGDA